MVKYDINSSLYKTANVAIFLGGILAGHGASTLAKNGKFGLEELIGGVLLAGSSIYYRHKCKVENHKKNLEREE